MVAVGNTLLYTFFAVLQVIINQLIGVKGNLKKILTPKGISGISQITYYIFIPVYSFLELARLGTLDKIRSYWIIFVCTLISIGIRTVSLYFLTKLLNFDKKVVNAFTAVISLPSLGSINLVLGKALCYPGCPLEDDQRCADVVGLMLVLMLVNNIYLYCVDFSMLILNENDYRFIKEKLSYVLTVLKKEDDFFVRYLFTKYIKEEKKAIDNYKDFIKSNRLIVNNDYKYIIASSESLAVENNDIICEVEEKNKQNTLNKSKLTDNKNSESLEVKSNDIGSKNIKEEHTRDNKDENNRFNQFKSINRSNSKDNIQIENKEQYKKQASLNSIRHHFPSMEIIHYKNNKNDIIYNNEQDNKIKVINDVNNNYKDNSVYLSDRTNFALNKNKYI